MVYRCMDLDMAYRTLDCIFLAIFVYYYIMALLILFAYEKDAKA